MKEGKPDIFDEQIFNKSVEEAKKNAEAAGFKLRTTMVDGLPTVITREIMTNRINVEVKNEKVVDFMYMG